MAVDDLRRAELRASPVTAGYMRAIDAALTIADPRERRDELHRIEWEIYDLVGRERPPDGQHRLMAR